MLSNSNITIYPNPVKGKLFVDLSEYATDIISSLKVINASSVVVELVEVSGSGTFSIVTSGYSNGIYLLHVLDGEEVITIMKFLVKR